jgi:hypothetical protein
MRTWFQQSFPTIGEWDFFETSPPFPMSGSCHSGRGSRGTPPLWGKGGNGVQRSPVAGNCRSVLERYLRPFSFEAWRHLCLRDVIKTRGYTNRCHSQGPSSFTHEAAGPAPAIPEGVLCGQLWQLTLWVLGTFLEHFTQGHISAVGILPCSRRNTVPCTCRPSA